MDDVTLRPPQAKWHDDSDENSDWPREWLMQSEEEDDNESTQSTGATSDVSYTHGLLLPILNASRYQF